MAPGIRFLAGTFKRFSLEKYLRHIDPEAHGAGFNRVFGRIVLPGSSGVCQRSYYPDVSKKEAR